MNHWTNWGRRFVLRICQPPSVCLAIPVFDRIAVLNKTHFIPGQANFNPQEGNIIR